MKKIQIDLKDLEKFLNHLSNKVEECYKKETEGAVKEYLKELSKVTYQGIEEKIIYPGFEGEEEYNINNKNVEINKGFQIDKPRIFTTAELLDLKAVFPNVTPDIELIKLIIKSNDPDNEKLAAINKIINN